MNYERLKTFITVCEQRSFSEAAKILFVTQPTITAHIKALEEELDTKLFERTTKKMNPTPSAEVLLQYGKQIIRLTDLAQKEIVAMNSSIQGNLQIGSSFTIGEYILPKFLKQFKDNYSMVDIVTKITNSTNIITHIKNRQIDIGLIETPMEDPQIVVEPILDDELVLIAPSNYPIPKNKAITIKELKKLPLILREKGSGTREVIERSLENIGVSEESLHIVMELGSTQAIKSAVEAGLGVAVVSKNVIKKEMQLKLINTYQIQDVSFKRSFYIVYRKDTVLKRTAESFLNHMKEFRNKKEVGHVINLPAVQIQ